MRFISKLDASTEASKGHRGFHVADLDHLAGESIKGTDTIIVVP